MAQDTEYRLRKIQFTKALRGYSCEEVDTYLAYVNDRYGTLGKECSDLKKKMAVMAAGQNEFREDALREKEKIAAEADALLQEKQSAAAKLVEDAKRKAARILADAETAAAGILKRAEEEADGILRRRQEEDENALREAGRKIAERNNAADRLVEEIDSFREEVFAIYAKHIEELERLSKITDTFYQTKEELTDVIDGTDAGADDAGNTDAYDEPEQTDDAVYMPVGNGTDAGTWDDPEEEYAPEEPAEALTEEDKPEEDLPTEELPDEDLLRIDWKKHRASREAADAAKAEEMASKTLWELADEVSEKSDRNPEETLAVAADVLEALADELENGSTDGDAEDDFVVPEPYEDAYENGEEPDAAIDEFDLLTEDKPEDEPEADDPDDSAEISEEDFLSDIASEYITPSRQKPPVPQKPANTPEEKPKKGKEAADLDELLTDAETRNVGLTGEFDIIFNSKNSAANVTEISRQPLVEAQRPEKPKKHSNKS